MADNTFLGLQPYTEDDAYRFKGRTEESQGLFRLIVRNDFTVCYAESGEGKTSLLNAGVFPLLRENMYFPISITLTSNDYKVTPDSFDVIIDRCIKNSITEYNEKNRGVNVEYKLCSTDFQGLSCQIDLQRELSKYSWWKLRNYRPQAMGLTFTPVFVFDQFEEVFNLPGSIVWTKKFFDWLEDVASDSCPDVIVKEIREMIGDRAAFPAIKEEKGFKAVFSLRKEFIGELDYWGMQTHFIPALKDNRYCLKALTYEGAKKVMTQQECFDEDKVELVLAHFVEQYSREPERTIEENLPSIPALLLSVVCDSWEKDIKHFSSKEIGKSLYIILERFYNDTIETVIEELSKQHNNTSPITLRNDIDTAMFALVDSYGKRIRTKTTSSILMQIGFDENYKTTLSGSHIIIISKIDGEDYVEIVHDSLCPLIAKKKEERLAKEADKKMHEKEEEIKKWQTFTKAIQTNLARFLAEKALQIIDNHDSYLARLIALQALPPNCPFTPEAEGALRTACNYGDTIFYGHTRSVHFASFSPDGKYIVSASRDKTCRIWDVKSGEQVGSTFEGHNNSVRSVAFSPDGKCIASSGDNVIRIWNTKSQKQVSSLLRGHTDRVFSVSFSPDGKYIVSASLDKTIRIWDVMMGIQVGEPLQGHTDSVLSAIFSPDGKTIVSASRDKTIRIWDVKNRKQVGSPMMGHNSSVRSVAFSPDGNYIVSASKDKTIRIWDVKTGVQVGAPLKGHTGSVYYASFCPDGKFIVSASLDKSVRIWDVKRHKQVGNPLVGHKESVNSACFSPDGLYIVSASEDNTIRIWDVKTVFQTKNSLIGHSDTVYSASFSPDGKKIVSASGDKTIRIWDVNTNMQIGSSLKGHTHVVNTAFFSPDGTYIVSSSDDNTIRIWNAITGQQAGASMAGHTAYVFSASYSPDEKYIVSASKDKTIRIWDVKTGQQIGKPLYGHTDYVYSALFSPTGEYIASGSKDNTIRIWDVKMHKQVGEPLKGHISSVNSISFSPNGMYIASASKDKTIRIWNIKTGEQIGCPFVGHTNIINSVSFCPDGKYVVSASLDKTVRIWDVKTSRQIGYPLVGHTNSVMSAYFSPDGKRIVSASWDHTIMIWDFPPLQQLIDETRERFKDRKLTDEEKRKYYLE